MGIILFALFFYGFTFKPADFFAPEFPNKKKENLKEEF